MPSKSPNDTVQAVEASFEILSLIRERDVLSLSEIADEVSMAKSTVHRHLRTLHDLHLVSHSDGEFRLGFELLTFGEEARNRGKDFQLVESKVKDIGEETGEKVQFMAEQSGVGYCIFRARGEHAVDTEPFVGSRMPLHATSAGKAVLAFLPDHRMRDILEQPLTKETPETVTEFESLRNELDRVRERGYAVNHEEHIEGLNAIAAPVRKPDGGVVGAISVSGPTKRFEDDGYEEEIRSQLLGETNELELNIAHKRNT